MSSTRRVQNGERRRQNGWASAAEYDVLRGINGTAVALKAALQESPEQRELLFFLQALSLREGGLKRLARELLEMFPERIGSQTMHKIGCKPSKRITLEQSLEIHIELNPQDYFLAGMLLDEPGAADISENYRLKKTAADCLSECHRLAAGLDSFIEELCCDPKMMICPEWPKSDAAYKTRVAESFDDDRTNSSYRISSVVYFRDILGALYEFKARYAEQAKANYAATSIGEIVFEALDYALETERSALIEGNSGFGKTTALKAWHEMHLGQSRYVQLSGITTRGAFLKRIARACGVANGDGLSMERIQYKVEEYLRRSGLLLIIDEGQYLWPQGRRITTHPELINWINTALYNEGVPFVISATKQFSARRQVVEQQTNWSSEQLRRRTRKVFPLPDVPTAADLRIVARKLLAGFGDAAIDFVVGYAMTSRGCFQAITDAVDDAMLVARRAGRQQLTAKDLQAAVKDWRAPSDAALQRVFDSKPVKQRRNAKIQGAAPIEFEPPRDEPTNHQSRLLQPACSSIAGRRETRPHTVPAWTG